MTVYRIMYDSVVVGIVVSHSGSGTDQALSAWNAANPSYAGDRAESAPFLEQP